MQTPRQDAVPEALPDFLVRPDPQDERLSTPVTGIDQTGREVEIRVVTERALTLYLNSQEIVTMMTIGDRPDLLAVGYLLNQNMLRPDDRITGIDYDDDLEVVVVRTERETDYEEKMKKKVRTSGCAQGTVFGDVMERFDEISLDPQAPPAHLLAPRPHPQDQHPALSLSGGRRDPRLRAVPGRPGCRVYGRRRAAQRRRQDRRLDVA